MISTAGLIVSMSYADYTYNSKNFLARFAHCSRFKLSIKFTNPQSTDKILDYGCGDGLFLNSIFEKCTVVGYEPYMQAVANNKVKICKSVEEAILLTKTNGRYNKVTCFEVLEHFNEKINAQLYRR